MNEQKFKYEIKSLQLLCKFLKNNKININFDNLLNECIKKNIYEKDIVNYKDNVESKKVYSNPWINHVKKISKEKNITYFEACKVGRDEYYKNKQNEN